MGPCLLSVLPIKTFCLRIKYSSIRINSQSNEFEIFSASFQSSICRTVEKFHPNKPLHGYRQSFCLLIFCWKNPNSYILPMFIALCAHYTYMKFIRGFSSLTNADFICDRVFSSAYVHWRHFTVVERLQNYDNVSDCSEWMVNFCIYIATFCTQLQFIVIANAQVLEHQTPAALPIETEKLTLFTVPRKWTCDKSKARNGLKEGWMVTTKEKRKKKPKKRKNNDLLLCWNRELNLCALRTIKIKC